MDYIDILSHNVAQIGELAGHLTKDFQQAHTEVPWVAMISMRNIIVHGYNDKFSVEFLRFLGKTRTSATWQQHTVGI
jgi:uncharacterized protein with HEPN domain